MPGENVLKPELPVGHSLLIQPLYCFHNLFLLRRAVRQQQSSAGYGRTQSNLYCTFFHPAAFLR
jgi:hypothetical protein